MKQIVERTCFNKKLNDLVKKNLFVVSTPVRIFLIVLLIVGMIDPHDTNVLFPSRVATVNQPSIWGGCLT